MILNIIKFLIYVSNFVHIALIVLKILAILKYLATGRMININYGYFYANLPKARKFYKIFLKKGNLIKISLNRKI